MNQKGLTLVELIVGLAITAIIALGSTSAYRSFVTTNELAADSNAFVSHFRYARSEAVTRHTRVTVCKSNNQTTCTTGGNWNQGWLVFVDSNESGKIESSEEILRVAAKQSGKVVGTQLIKDYISFDSTGNLRQTSGALQVGQLIFCDSIDDANNNRFIELLPTGRARVVSELSAQSSSCAVA